MKRFKNKLTAMILIVAVLATLFAVPAFAAEEAVTTATVESDAMYAFELLNALGITDVAQGDDLGAKISRAEFAALLTSFAGLENVTVNSGVKFNDVLPGSFDEPYITTVVASDYMQAVTDGYFYPAWEITAVDAARAFLMTLGYNSLVMDNAVFNNFARTLKIYDGVDTKNFTRGEVYKMMYNALMAPVMDQTGFGEDVIYEQMKDITGLYRFHDIIRSEGAITGAEGVILGSGGKETLEDGLIEFDGIKFTSPGFDMASILGREVYLYWRDVRGSDLDTVIHVEVINDNAVVLGAEQIVGYSNGVYEYEVEGTKSTKKISVDTPYVIYNGEEYNGAYSKEMMIPDNGDVTVIENIKEGRELVIIRNFKDVLVKLTINDDEDQIIIGEKKNERYDLGEYAENVKYYDEFGLGATLGDVKAGNVVSIAQSASGEKTIVYISTTMVNGSLTLYDGNYWTIDETEYPLSAAMIDSIQNKTVTVPEFNKNYNFYININGEIAFYEEAATGLPDGVFYGILVSAKTGSGFETDVALKVWSKTMGGFEVYEVADKLELNGESAEKEDVVYALKRNGRDGIVGETVVPQPIKIGLNDENQVNYLFQAASTNADGKGFFYYMGSTNPSSKGNYFQYRDVLIYSKMGGTDYSNSPTNNGNLSIGVGNKTEYVQIPYFAPKGDDRIGAIDVASEKAFISTTRPTGNSPFVVYKENDDDLTAAFVIRATASGEKEHCEKTVNIHCVLSITKAVVDEELVTKIKTNKMVYYINDPKINLDAVKIWQTNEKPDDVTAWIDPETGKQGVHKVVPGDLVNIAADSLGYIKAIEIVYDSTNNRMMGKGTGTDVGYGYINTDVAWFSRGTEHNLLLLNVLYTKDGYICATDAKDPADFEANPLNHRRYIGKVPPIICVDTTGKKLTTRNAVNSDLIGYNESSSDYATVILSHRYAQQSGTSYTYKR